jgi:hypothetical protein
MTVELTLAELERWAAHGFPPDLAAAWRAVSPLPIEADEWRWAIDNPAAAVAWRSAGFTPDSVRGWVRRFAGQPELAARWADHGFSPADAERWTEQGFDVELAAAWRRTGLDESAAAAWRDAGFGTGTWYRWSLLERNPHKAGALARAHHLSIIDAATARAARTKGTTT